MRDSDRFKLYFGPYKTPRFKYGKKVWCDYDALRKANLGKPLSTETREKMSQSHRKRGTRPPWLNDAWSNREDKLLRDGLPTAEVVKRTGRTATAVCLRRLKLKLPPPGHVTYQGKTQSIPAWAREVGMTPGALRLRLKQLPISKALTMPKQPRVRLDS